MVRKRQFELHDGKNGAAIAVRITPRTSKNEIFAILDDGTVKIRLTAPPVEGKANQALIKYLSDVLDIPASNIEIVAGQTGHDKLVSIIGLTSETVQQKLLLNLTP